MNMEAKEVAMGSQAIGKWARQMECESYPLAAISPLRRAARPQASTSQKKWEQDFVDYIKNVLPKTSKSWHDLARNQEWWLAETEKFANS